MPDPLRQLRPPTLHVVAAVGDPDLRLGRFRVWSEGHYQDAIVVDAYGIVGAMDMAATLWPDGDPWGAEPVDE